MRCLSQRDLLLSITLLLIMQSRNSVYKLSISTNSRLSSWISINSSMCEWKRWETLSKTLTSENSSCLSSKTPLLSCYWALTSSKVSTRQKSNNPFWASDFCMPQDPRKKRSKWFQLCLIIENGRQSTPMTWRKCWIKSWRSRATSCQLLCLVFSLKQNGWRLVTSMCRIWWRRFSEGMFTWVGKS